MNDAMFDKYGVTFKKGQILFCEYEPGADMYVMKSGKVRISKIIDDREKTLDVFVEGDFLGEMALLESAPRTATAIAVEDSAAMRFNKENFEHLVRGNPQIALRLLKTFCIRIADAKRRLVTMGLKSDEDKIIDTLLMLAEKRGASPDSNTPIEMETTEADIANWCSVPIDDARKILRSLMNQGKIIISTKKMILKTYGELTRFISSKRKHMS